MTTVSADKILSIIPELFETDFSGNVKLFQKLEKFLMFDEGFIYYVNPDSLQLKFMYKTHIEFEKEALYPFNLELKKTIFSKDGSIMNENSNLIKVLGLDKFGQKSFLVSKILIRSTVFGLVVLSSKKTSCYKIEDLRFFIS